jgi:molybdate/tungstate transport system ATP-binding protein
MTPDTAVEGLSLTLGDFNLDKLDFTLSRGETLVILGPNGSGKSVTLETIAGFHRPNAGCVRIGGRDVTGLPPERRNVAFLVQNFGLFPHLTVEQNVAIALRGGHASTAAPDASLPYGDVPKLLARFEVTHLARRTPQTLSPGEKQRVAFARALAAQPDLFLFDEPFSALDTHTREQLREELLAFLRRLSLPAIFVTHDHSDAMTLADKIIVLRNGRSMQAGSADEIFRKPTSVFVARFVGVENILGGRIGETRGGLVTVFLGGQALQAVKPTRALGPNVQVCIRADAVKLGPRGNAPPAERVVNRFVARMSAVRGLGPLTTVQLDGEFPLKAYALSRQVYEMELIPGSAIEVEIPAESVHLMPD